MCSPDGGVVSGLGLGREDFDAVTKEKRGRAGATAADDGGELDLDETQAKYEYQMVLDAQQLTKAALSPSPLHALHACQHLRHD
jgi:hypothetical protein